MRRRYDQTALDTKLESLPEQSSLPIDSPDRSGRDTVLGVSGQSVVNVVVNDFRAHIHGTHVAKCLANRLQVRLKLRLPEAARDPIEPRLGKPQKSTDPHREG